MDGADSFSASDFLTPTNHLGRYMTTRAYGNQSGAPKYLRGAGSLGGYEADPWHTGIKDSNRGVVPASFADMIQLGGSLKTKARRATSAEKLLMGDLAGKNNLSSMVHMSRRNMMRAPCMLEMSLRFPYSLGSWDTNHPTFWLMQDQPASGFDGLELDCEGFAPAFQFNVNRWVNGSQVQNGNPGNTQTVSQTDYRTYSFEVKQNAGVWTAYLYEEGVLVGSTPCSGGSFTFDPTRPFYIMITSHILQSGITQSVWDAAGDAGATIDCDWWRAWGSGTFRKPLKPDVLLKADFNTAFSFDLDTPQAVFGSDVSSDVIAMIPNEDNSPAQPWVRALLPAAIVRSGNNISGTVSDQPGRFISSRSATPSAGDGCIPQAITLCIGPRVVPTQIQYTVGQAFTFDLYQAVDCGDLHMGKIISTSGWPAWATVDIANGLVTGMPTDTGNTTVTISGTNAVGQSVTASVALQKYVAPTYDYMSWDGPLWIDASDTATITQSGGVVTGVANKRSGSVDMVKAGAANITLVANAQNGKSVLRFAANTAGSPARLQPASANSPIDTMQQGNDKPYVKISVYKPTDGNTGFIDGWSDTVPSADCQQIALIRRSASASSIRRSTTTSVTNDVSWGSGQATGVLFIVVESHTGTTLTVFDSSLTKVVNNVAQDANTFNSELTYYIGAAETGGATDPTFAPTVCAMDYCENILTSAKTDAELQQCISDLATKWGKTLT
ncbi:hypothetical protein DTW90_18405 [Neorhizobium sp. P12A]|nr:hypothetical protein DTW90_18405 [Neorhizobium sp. P12A]